MSTTAAVARLRAPPPDGLAPATMMRATSSPNYAPAVASALSPQSLTARQVLGPPTTPNGVATAPIGVSGRMVSSTATYASNGGGGGISPIRLQSCSSAAGGLSVSNAPFGGLSVSNAPSAAPSVRSLSPRRPASVSAPSTTMPSTDVATLLTPTRVYGASIRTTALQPEGTASRGASTRASQLQTEALVTPQVTYIQPPSSHSMRDESEMLMLRTGLEEKAILVAEYQRRNRDLVFAKDELERQLAARTTEEATQGGELEQLRGAVRNYEGRCAEKDAEIENLAQRCDKLSALMEEQTKTIEDLELKDAQQLTEISALRNASLELEKVAEQQAQRIAELEELQAPPARPTPPPSPAPAHERPNTATDDQIDGQIQEFFRTHPDFQVGVSRERAGFYTFDRPIGKRVSMKISGDKVLARTGGGWTEVWEWLSQERIIFLEAEGALTNERAQAEVQVQGQAKAPTSGKKRPSANGRPSRASSSNRSRASSGLQR